MDMVLDWTWGFEIRVFLLLDGLPAKAHELYLPKIKVLTTPLLKSGLLCFHKRLHRRWWNCRDFKCNSSGILTKNTNYLAYRHMGGILFLKHLSDKLGYVMVCFEFQNLQNTPLLVSFAIFAFPSRLAIV